MYGYVKNELKDWEDGPVSKYTCHQSWQSEFASQDPHDGRRELVPISCPMTATPCCNMSLPSYQINKYNLILNKDDLKTPIIECLMGYEESAVAMMDGP